MSLTVACVWVRANVPYGVEYVANLRAMVARNLARPFRFVCLTDRPELMPGGVEGFRTQPHKGLFGWWSKIELFAEHRFCDRVLYLDLDTLVVAPLDPIVDFPSPFALIPDAGSFKPKTQHQVVKRFNSSVMVWDADRNMVLHAEWKPSVAEHFWGDQDWIGHQRPHADTMPLAWFPRLSELNGQPPSQDAKVVLVKRPKNHVAADLYPWVGEIWRAA